MTDTKQPEALRLADALERGTYLLYLERDNTATELRRLHSLNQELLEALKQVMTWIDNWDPEFTYDPDWPTDEDKAKTAIAKAEVTK
jgi:hypothetical protein